MREIKFRAWDGEKMDSRWKDGRLVIDASTGEAQKIGYGSTPFNVSIPQGLTLMQCTGLKDKNGVEIYEGDIVRGRFVEEHLPDAMWLTLSDQEREQGFRLFTIRTIFEPYETPMPDDIEIIGNIYENPELLEEKPNE